MKRIGLISTTIILFAVSLYAAYVQGSSYAEAGAFAGGHLAAPVMDPVGPVGNFANAYLDLFSGLMSKLTGVLGGSLMASVIVLALLVELVTLYSAVNLQLKQKKIHLFHKKLVDRFHKGELTMSKTKRELDVLYSVNERIHRRGALLFGFQLVVFLFVMWGLSMTAQFQTLLHGAFSSFNFSLLSRPTDAALPIVAGLAYMLHALVKIQLKQREDYISQKQVYTALGFGIIASALVFYFASIFAVLLTVYFLTQITFATMRYLIVEDNAQAWGKYAQRDLIHMLRTSKLHKNKVEHWSRKFNHLPLVRNLNFHLLEEALSMSLAIVLALNGMALM